MPFGRICGQVANKVYTATTVIIVLCEVVSARANENAITGVIMVLAKAAAICQPGTCQLGFRHLV
jgi:hypothetical protein